MQLTTSRTAYAAVLLSKGARLVNFGMEPGNNLVSYDLEVSEDLAEDANLIEQQVLVRREGLDVDWAKYSVCYGQLKDAGRKLQGAKNERRQ